MKVLKFSEKDGRGDKFGIANVFQISSEYFAEDINMRSRYLKYEDSKDLWIKLKWSHNLFDIWLRDY